MLHPSKFTFSFGLIGGSNLTISCGEWLLANGHQIIWTLPRGKSIADWATQKQIAVFDSQESIQATSHSVDFIFSIVNDLLLTPEFLKLPRRFAINYHNALLPRYGGVFATSWAILNKEKEHGITWHQIESTIDTGNLLAQRKFKIKKSDTGYSLNQHCYEAAFSAFKELLLPALESGNPGYQKQDLKKTDLLFSA